MSDLNMTARERVEDQMRDRFNRVSVRLVGPDRYMNDAWAHALVCSGVTKDQAITDLLDERQRLIDELVTLRKLQPVMYVIGGKADLPASDG